MNQQEEDTRAERIKMLQTDAQMLAQRAQQVSMEAAQPIATASIACSMAVITLQNELLLDALDDIDGDIFKLQTIGRDIHAALGGMR